MAMNLSMIMLIFFFLLPSVSAYHVFSAASQFSYADYCSSIIPEPVSNSGNATYRYSGLHIGYYTGGDGVLNPIYTRISNSFSFRITVAQETNENDVFKVEGYWLFRIPYYYQRSPLYFRLHGFWSTYSGKLCMVGTGSAQDQGNHLSLAAVLKLSNFKNHSSITSLITGTLESLSSPNDKNYFEPISMLILPRLNYAYAFTSGESMDGLSGGSAGAGSTNEKNLPFNVLPMKRFCSIFSVSGAAKVFNLQYRRNCSSAKNCLHFDGHMPTSVSLNSIQCLELNMNVHLLVEFHNTSNVGLFRRFNPETTLVGEGVWDNKTDQLHVVACQFLDTAGTSWSNARVGNCSTRLSLRFPAVLSIRETSTVMGQISTNKTANDSGYFERVLFRSTENRIKGFPGLNYEYTETNRVKKLCPTKKPSKGEKYPSAHSYDMKFDISVKNSKRKLNIWGFAEPISVDSSFYEEYVSPSALPRLATLVPATGERSSPVNISYRISTSSGALSAGISRYDITNEKMEITAEGTYDAKTGFLCMVGCRRVVPNNQMAVDPSMDCEILLNFQLPALRPTKNGGYVKGSIKSMRKESDPLYFRSMVMSSAAYSVEKARQSIWRMDLEITISLISNTLACFFVGLQLYHVKKYPEVLSFISLVMLLILTMGYMIPLVLNFEALFLKNRDRNTVLFSIGGWLEANEVIVRIVTMVAFLLQFRLLQLTWSARSDHENQKDLWFADKMSFLVSLPLFAAGAFITLLVNWNNNRHDEVLLLSTQLLGNQQHSLWGNLRTYAGLVLDGFLLPQLLLNLFLNSRQNALSLSYYLGTTFVRLLPHAYDIYRNHCSTPHYVRTYVYATPGADFYSAAWDVIILIGGLLFAAIIYLQQRFGGRCFLPQRFREFDTYDKVPTDGES